MPRGRRARCKDDIGPRRQGGGTIRPRRRGALPLFPPCDVWREAQDYADLYEILYPDADVVPAAASLAAVHGLSWYDALMLAYVERRGLATLYSEDFADGRRYGSVRVVNPFAAA